MKEIKSYVLLLTLFIPLSVAGSMDTLCKIQKETAVLDIWSCVQVFVDSTGQQSYSEILTKGHWENLQPYQHSKFPITYWLRFTISAPDTIRNFHLVFQRESTHDVSQDLESFLDINLAEVWYTKEGEIIKQYRTGFFTDQEERALPNRLKDAVPLSINAGDTLEVYIRVQNLFEQNDYYLGMQIENPRTVSTQQSRFIPFGFFLSSIYFILGIFCLIFFFVVKEWEYLLFSLFCLVVSPHFNLEYFFELFPDFFLFEEPALYPFIFTCSTSLGFVLFLIFGRKFSNIKELLPGWDRFYIIMIGLTFIAGFYLCIQNLHAPFEPNPAYFMIVFFGNAPVFIRLLLHPQILARVFGIGATLMIVFFSLGFLWAAGVEMPIHPFYWGFMTVVLFFSLGLAWKIRFNERAKAEAEQILELDKMKSRFFANISHEFRTPISLILGPLNQAEEQLPASEELDTEEEVPIPGKYIKMMKRNTLRLQNLVNQLLDLSKLESGASKLQVQKGNIVGFLRPLVFSFESRAENRNIDFHTIFPKEVEDVWFDPDKLEKIVINLLSNAFKYTPDNGQIEVKVYFTGNKIKIQVGDSGPGIKPDELEKIFDRFYRIESDQVEGTGIGLSLVKELVDQYRGQISVDSLQGEGTTFKLNLPFKKASFKQEELIESTSTVKPEFESAIIEPSSNSQNKVKADKGEKPLILIVEDNLDLRIFIKDLLKNEYNVLEAKNGKSGLEKAVEFIPDLIVSDIMMPEMDGFEFGEKIKKNQKTSHVPLILLTAKAGQEHKLEGLETGADAYLTKPFDRKELIIRIQNLIQQRNKLREKFTAENTSLWTHPKANSMDEQFLQNVFRKIEENLNNEFYTVEELAKSIGFSRSQLFRKLKALIDKSPSELIREMRLERAHHLLLNNSGTVSEIAYMVGYSNLSYFTKSFKKKYGKMPSEL